MIGNLEISFYLNTSSPIGEHLFPIFCKTTVFEQSKDFEVGINIPLEHWDENKAQVVCNDHASQYNKLIKALEYQITDVFTDFKIKQVPFDVAKLLNTVKNKHQPQPTLMQVARMLSERYTKRYKAGEVVELVARQKYTWEKNIARFMKHKYGVNDMLLADITADFGEEYYYFRRTVCNCSEYHAAKMAGYLKRVLNHAISLGYLQYNPLAGTKFKRGVAKQLKSLTSDEVKQIITLKIEDPSLNHCKNLFCAQLFTGLSYGDLVQFDNHHILADNTGALYIQIDRKKTGSTSIIPLLPEFAMIIKKCRNVNPTDRKVQKVGMFYVFTNQYYNDLLKEVGKLAGISTDKMSSHTARKTFGCLMLNTKGISLENVSAFLGHKSLRVTQDHYARVGSKRVLAETSNISFASVLNDNTQSVIPIVIG